MQENEMIHGFRVVRVREVKDCDGTLYELTHEKTGAEVCWMDRDDDNKTFCIGFKTIPSDDTGVFHICEHSVLNGSEKYPLREPFVDLLKSSMQTFLNAMTYPDKTIYPIASRNDKDFLNLMDVYLDGVFHPAIYTNPNIFYQEGWHYEIRKKEDTPVVKGVVYNEMKGAFSSMDEILVYTINKALYPDTCYQYESGGLPECIPDLTYENFKKAHARFYHPSASRTFLDGKLDIDAVLEKLNSFFEPYEKEERGYEIPYQKDVEPKDLQARYEIGSEEEEKDKTTVSVSKVLCTYKDVETILAWQVLASLLTGNNESPFTKTILDQKLGQDVEMDVMDEIKQPFLSLEVRNTNPEQKDAILDALKSCAEELVKNGLNHSEIQASLNQMEFRYRERKEPFGVMLAQTSYRSWMYGDDPLMYMEIGNLFDDLRTKTEEGYFEALLNDSMFVKRNGTVITLVPSKTLKQERDEKELQRCLKAKASWGEGIQEYIDKNAALDGWQASEDTPEQKATLPVLELSDVNDSPKPYHYEETEIASVPVVVHDEDARGIVYLNLYFNVAGVTVNRLPKLSAYVDLLKELATERHSAIALQELIRSKLGTLSFSVDAYTQDRNPESTYPVVCVSCSVLKQNLKDAVDMILEILQETQFSKESIEPLIHQSYEGYRQAMIQNGHSQAVLRVGAHFSSESRAKEGFNGYEAGNYMKLLSEHYEKNIEDFLNEIVLFKENLFTKSRLIASVSGSSNLPEVERLIQALPDSDAKRCNVRYPLLTEEKEGIVIPSQVGYCAYGSSYKNTDFRYKGSVRVMAQILTYGYLWNEVRVKGGAYGTGFASSPNGNYATWSFRDPTPENSIEIAKAETDYILSLVENKTDLTSFIISAIAAGEPVLSPMQKIRSGDIRYITHTSYEDRKQLRYEMLHTTLEDLKEAALALREGNQKAVSCVIGSKDSIGEERDCKSI